MARHLHLDPLGGIAGDMFAAAMLDVMPELEDRATGLAAVLLGDETKVEIARQSVGGFFGCRVKSLCRETERHRHLRDIVEMIEACDALSDRGRAIAVDIFRRLAEAEAAVHNTRVDEVHFHEVGAADAILDIALAGLLIDAADARTYSIGPLPMGGGTVQTEHGVMPVPAPATARLLEGFVVHDDGIGGERVTPTGAAILAHLKSRMVDVAPPGRFGRSGMGFGTRTLPDRPNALRVVEITGIADGATDSAGGRDTVMTATFEVDDQTPEDLAHALDRIRATAGVLDVVQYTATGKKGRVVACVRVLCEPAARAQVLDEIFVQTTTLGIREQWVARSVLGRKLTGKEGVPVKIADRLGRKTCKAEFDVLTQKAHDHASREALRRRVEQDD